jgi:methylthioribulose-1-phosphate dehydratase
LQPEDFLLVDERGQSLDRSGKASEELSVHQEIYRLTEATAVFHVHSVSNNLASRLWLEAGQVILEDIEMIKGISGKTLHDRIQLPIVSNSQDMRSLAQSVAAAVGPECPAVLVYQHGIYAWGQNAETARRHVEIFEFLLEYAVKLHGLGLTPRDSQGRGIV